MSPDRKASITAGALIFLGTGAGVLSIAPAVDGPSYLLDAAQHEPSVLVAALFQLVMAFAYVGFAVALYPILRDRQPWLAFGFASFRIIGGVFVFLGLLSLPLMGALSRAFASAGAPDDSYFQVLGELLRTARDLVNHVATIVAVCIGNLMLHALLYEARLVPRWLAGWGLVGAAMSLSASLLVMFRALEIITVPYLALNAPMGLQDIVLAVWLLAKGLRPGVPPGSPVPTPT